jgi:malate synthase
MEDAATAEISRSQVWQWINARVQLDTGETVTEELVRRVIDEEVAGIGDLDRLDDARTLFEQVALAAEFPDFLTLPAYELIVEGPRPPGPPHARVGPLDGAVV